jgi:hypothetical protein
MLGSGLAEQSGLALVFQSEALAIDVDDDGVVKDPIEHRHGEHSVAGEGAIPTAEAEVGDEDHCAAFVTLRDDLEEQIGQLTLPAALKRTRRGIMAPDKNPTRRCAIYTRKSSEEGGWRRLIWDILTVIETSKEASDQ